MLNILWPIFIIISIIYAVISGNIESLNDSIFDSTQNVVEFSISLIGLTCLWSGIMEVAARTKMVDYLCKILNPISKILFPNLKENNKIKKNVMMNIIANILGLGNAATPLGLKAMEDLQRENDKKDTLSDNMMILIVLNTASLQVIPTTVLAIRSSFGSKNPSLIIFPVWIATICAAIVGVVITKIIIKITDKKRSL